MTEEGLVLLTEEQDYAVKEALETLDGDFNSDYQAMLTVGGYAGTGKTTIIKYILKNTTGRLAVGAYTGKAVSVLRHKGVTSAQTLHSLMYVPVKVGKEVEYRKRFALGASRDEYDTYDPGFTGVIVDEASMLNKTLYEDLLSFGLPVVFIGDHGQLEPIGDNPGVMENPEIRLEKIHRQAAGSLILRLAHGFREGKAINWASIPPGRGLALLDRKEAQETCHEYDAVLCGFNDTRHAYNKRIRKAHGFTGRVEVGERLICLRNNRDTGVFNGMMLYVLEVHGEGTTGAPASLPYFELDLIDDTGQKWTKVKVYMVKPKQEVNDLDLREGNGSKRNIIVCDYGYALTVHKAQGSEYDKVLVIEEIWYEKWNPNRWRYTAATRAAKELAWVS